MHTTPQVGEKSDMAKPILANAESMREDGAATLHVAPDVDDGDVEVAIMSAFSLHGLLRP